METYFVGQTLSNLRIKPGRGFQVTFAIYQRGQKRHLLIGPPHRRPVCPSEGVYYAALQIPPSAVPGEYSVVWSIDSGSREIRQPFRVRN